MALDSSRIPETCFLRVSIAGEAQSETVVVGLLTKDCPETCRNFVNLCGSIPAPEKTSRKRPLPTYRGCEFHRIIPGFMVQAGDFERFDGTGGFSPGPKRTLRDENLRGKHDGPGILSMANKGTPHSGGSQFFVTLKATPHLDGKHVVFGRVLRGMEAIHRMAAVETVGDRPVPLQRVVVDDCGIGTGPDPPGSAQREATKTKRKHGRGDASSDDDSSRSSSSSSSESERRRKKRKKRRRRHEKHRKRSKSRKRSYGSDEEDTSKDEDRRRRSRSKSSKHHKSDRHKSGRHKSSREKNAAGSPIEHASTTMPCSHGRARTSTHGKIPLLDL